MESYLKDKLEAITGPITFVQENESMSCYGVTRGLHFQKEPMPNQNSFGLWQEKSLM